MFCLENAKKKIFQLISNNTTIKRFESTPVYKLFFNDEVVTYICKQSKINASSRDNFVLHVTPKEFCAFSAIVLISGCTYLSWRRMHWQQEANVFNCAVADLLPGNRFEEILRYATLTASDKLAKMRSFF